MRKLSKPIERKRNRLFFKIQRVSTLLTILIGILCVYSFFAFKPWEKKLPFVSPLASAMTKTLHREVSDTQVYTVKKMLEKKGISFVDIKESTESAFIVLLKNGEEIRLASNKPIDPQISSLQLILSRLTIEGKKLGSLDFRYDKPIVVFK